MSVQVRFKILNKSPLQMMTSVGVIFIKERIDDKIRGKTKEKNKDKLRKDRNKG